MQSEALEADLSLHNFLSPPAKRKEREMMRQTPSHAFHLSFIIHLDELFSLSLSLSCTFSPFPPLILFPKMALCVELNLHLILKTNITYLTYFI